MSDDDIDIFGLLASLPRPEVYTPQDKYRDFRLVFLGTDDGKRVLHQILKAGHLTKPSLQGSPIDPLQMAVMEGERNMALRIAAAVLNEPKAQPTQQNKRQA